MAHGTEVAHQRMIEQELLFGMTIGALGAGALAVDRLIERAIAMCADALIVPCWGSPTPLGERWLKCNLTLGRKIPGDSSMVVNCAVRDNIQSQRPCN